jgi:hypothetical protein
LEDKLSENIFGTVLIEIYLKMIFSRFLRIVFSHAEMLAVTAGMQTQYKKQTK